MGKKDKKDKKKKGLGKAKTEAKAAKKEQRNEKKVKKAAQGTEDDVEALLAEFVARDAAQTKVSVIQNAEKPSPRVNFSWTPSPIKDTHIILFGGERYTGDHAAFFADLYIYHIDKNSWSRYDSPNRPPPRSAHAAAAYKQWLYIFGGEFSSPNQNQFHHFRDLWRLDLEDMSWEKIAIRGGPTGRSGARMTVCNSTVLLFGGFIDHYGRDTKYLDDLYMMDLNAEELMWKQIELPHGVLRPSPRSGFQWVTTDHTKSVYLYGGYYKEPIKKKNALATGLSAMSSAKKQKNQGNAPVLNPENGIVLTDMWRLDCSNLPQPQVKWEKCKRSGYGPPPRSGFSSLAFKGLFVLFGGVQDLDVTEESITESEFANDIFAFNLERKKWFPMTLRRKKKRKSRRNKVKAQEPPQKRQEKAQDSKDIEMEGNDDVKVTEDTDEDVENEDGDNKDGDGDGNVDDDDDNEIDFDEEEEEEPPIPCGRINAGVALIRNIMYVFGGILEEGDKEYTLDDLWQIDLQKLDEWKCVIPLSDDSKLWNESEKEEDSDSSSDEGSNDESDEGSDEDGDDDSKDEGNEDKDDAENTERKEREKKNRRQKRLQDQLNELDAKWTPQVGETLREFFDRTKYYWAEEVHEATGETGKASRSIAFTWAKKRYEEIKPALFELEELQRMLSLEEKAEELHQMKEADIRREKNRR